MTNRDFLDNGYEPDMCLTCGKHFMRSTLGVVHSCSCKYPNIVHQAPCESCGKLVGYCLEDYAYDIEMIYCPACLNKFRKL